MYKIARFLKVNGALYGARGDEDRHFDLPSGQAHQMKLWPGWGRGGTVVNDSAASVRDSRGISRSGNVAGYLF